MSSHIHVSGNKRRTLGSIADIVAGVDGPGTPGTTTLDTCNATGPNCRSFTEEKHFHALYKHSHLLRPSTSNYRRQCNKN